MQEKTYSAEQMGLAARFAEAEAKLPADKKVKFFETMNAVLLGVELGTTPPRLPCDSGAERAQT